MSKTRKHVVRFMNGYSAATLCFRGKGCPRIPARRRGIGDPVIGTAPRPAQEDELLPLATTGASADRPRLRIATSSALRASLMIKDRVLTAPSGVRGGSCIERLRWGAVGRPSSLTLAQRPSPQLHICQRPCVFGLLPGFCCRLCLPSLSDQRQQGVTVSKNVTLKIARGAGGTRTRCRLVGERRLTTTGSIRRSNLNSDGSKLIIE
jgi:hypothetical protein